MTAEATDNGLVPLPRRSVDAHKGQCGRILVIAGSVGMTGAGCMAAKSAMRSGAGVVLWAIPKSLNAVAEALSLEVMSLPIPETPSGSPSMEARKILVEAARETDCVILGPGLPVAGETGELMRLLIPEIFPPVILDGGALSAIGDDVMTIRKRQGATIVTPHPGEMARLTGKTVKQVQEKRRDFAAKYAKFSGAVVVLKGARTMVADASGVFEISTGNPGMATAGSGDVLTGVIAALVGQGLLPGEAARLGAHLHGLAGDIAMVEKGVHGLIASDMVERLPDAFLRYASRTGDGA